MPGYPSVFEWAVTAKVISPEERERLLGVVEAPIEEASLEDVSLVADILGRSLAQADWKDEDYSAILDIIEVLSERLGKDSEDIVLKWMEEAPEEPVAGPSGT